MNASALRTTARLEDTTESERTYAMLTHLAGMLSLLDHVVIGLIASFIMWRIRKDDSTFIDDHGREAVNFQLSMLLYVVAGGMVIAMTFGLGAFVIAPLLLALWVVRLVAGIRGSVAANKGERCRYPICIRFIPDAA